MKSLILSMMEQYGYPGLLALIFLEHVFPPIPSEVILPFGGFLTLHTALSVPGVVLFATIGSLAGALVLYGAGFLLNRERLTRLTEGKFGKILHLNGEDLEKAESWFRKKGQGTVLFCRCIPVVRSLISIPAGMSRMDLSLFLLYTTIGSLIWNILLVSLGAFLGESWEYLAWLVGEYSHVMLIILGISGLSWGIGLFLRRKFKE